MNLELDLLQIVVGWFLEKLMLPLNNWISLMLLDKGSVVEPVTHVEQGMCGVHVLMSWFLLQWFHTFSKTWLIEFWAYTEVCLDILCKSPQKTICTSAAYVFTPLWSSVISLALGYWTLQTYAFYCYFLVVFKWFFGMWTIKRSSYRYRTKIFQQIYIFSEQKSGKVLFFLV